ncbi:MAG: Gfo/Idh/MocA family oxidoreductase [Actinobacteria bacterium]|jgi:predicted dehydrogenase|nr:Gfo/Idh/MocA family oxidoreductase [Actinomycetota bacterium]
MAEKVLNLAFVGLGQAVNRVLYQHPEVHDLPYRIVAAADPRAQAREAFERDFDGRAFADFESILEMPEVDVVYVATPPELHCEQTIQAAEAGKHVLVEKPMALSLDDALLMCRKAEDAGVKLLAGHTKCFDAPIIEMTRLAQSGRYGPMRAFTSMMYNSFNVMPWPTPELADTMGPVLNQGPHQLDIARQIGGGVVTSVTATTFHDSLRDVTGGYQALLRFDSGSSATLTYDARGLFDIAELYGWIGEGGQARPEDLNARMRRNIGDLLERHGRDGMDDELERQKEVGRYGAKDPGEALRNVWGYAKPDEPRDQPFFGMSILSLDQAAVRQSRDGLYLYTDGGRNSIDLQDSLRARAAELLELYRSIRDDRPVFHDGWWGAATLEACLALAESAATGGRVELAHQVPTPSEIPTLTL